MTAKAVEVYLKQKRKKEAGQCLLDMIGPDAATADALEELERGRIEDRS